MEVKIPETGLFLAGRSVDSITAAPLTRSLQSQLRVSDLNVTPVDTISRLLLFKLELKKGGGWGGGDFNDTPYHGDGASTV